MVGLATFDNTIHFYSVRSPTAAPQMLVVSDVNDVYAPSSARLLMPVRTTIPTCLSCLSSICNDISRRLKIMWLTILKY